MYPFSFSKYNQLTGRRFYQYSTILKVRPFLWQSLYKYIPSSKNFEYFLSLRLFILGILSISCFYHFESRLWKERKWDREAGQTIPIRNRLILRAYNYIYNIKILPFLYYFGINVEDVDLNIQVDIKQISEGRLYRRFLCMQYARKMGYQKFRKSSYDFLEVSENYGQD
jgi:hypothetical protein